MYVFIHRRDLRISDMPGFRYGSEKHQSGLHIFILDDQLLGTGRHAEPSGRAFLQRLEALEQQYAYYDKTLNIVQGELLEVLELICSEHDVSEIVYHRDMTPYARRRDESMAKWANDRDIKVTAFLEHPLVEPDSFQRFHGKPEGYKVFTPFYKKWMEYLLSFPPVTDWLDIQSLNTIKLSENVKQRFPANPDMYPVRMDLRLPIASDAPRKRLAGFLETQVEHYKQSRDEYYYDSTSRLSLFLNTGSISVREVYHTVTNQRVDGSDPWIRQLAWRDFYLYQSVLNPNYYDYEKQYDFSMLTDQHFERWATGETGIPIIDAAMRELNETGHMHNRLRMVTAMFLTKNLLCPFTLGEQYFRRKLLDYDNALNRGGWLWSSSLGYDGAPYFRVMNPVSQSQRFDVQGVYLKRWVPELKHLSQEQIHLEQANAIVNLKISRENSIQVYKQIIEKVKHDNSK